MAEYIKLKDAIREIEQINPVDYGAMWDYEAHHWVGECLRDCKEAIDSIPVADVAPVVHSYWEHKITNDEENIGICHNCKYPVSWFWKLSNYCPNCGAKMDGGANHAST